MELVKKILPLVEEIPEESLSKFLTMIKDFLKDNQLLKGKNLTDAEIDTLIADLEDLIGKLNVKDGTLISGLMVSIANKLQNIVEKDRDANYARVLFET